MLVLERPEVLIDFKLIAMYARDEFFQKSPLHIRF
jgi:hypothetical protein